MRPALTISRSAKISITCRAQRHYYIQHGVLSQKKKRKLKFWQSIKQMLRWQINSRLRDKMSRTVWFCKSGCYVWGQRQRQSGGLLRKKKKSWKWHSKYMSSLVNPADTQSQCEISWEELFLSHSLYLTPTHTSINRKETANETNWVVCALWKEQSVLSSTPSHSSLTGWRLSGLLFFPLPWLEPGNANN